MERRKFIKSTAILSAPLLFNKIPVMASPNVLSKEMQAMANAAAECGKILVIITMGGGTDGLGTIFPRDKYSQLNNARSNILIPETSILTLNSNVATGLHPTMPELQNLYNNGKMMIVQGVDFPIPNYSHFRSTDMWATGANDGQVLETGWLGRALDISYPNFPQTYPNATMPDPLSVQIGSNVPFSLQGPSLNMGYCVQNPNDLLNVINAVSDPAPNSDYGAELTFLRLMKDQSNAYRSSLQNAYNVPQPISATYPNDNGLADQLKVVARLINGGLKTPVYIVNHPEGFDTHENQVEASNKEEGRLATNLRILSKAIGAFQQDLALMGKENKVTTMTFSEFGRRIKSNNSMGTDHGTAAPVMFFGAGLNTGPSAIAGTAHPVSGMIGTSPLIPQNATVDDDVPMQFDFRQVYSSILQDWLCMTEAQSTAVLGAQYAKLPIFRTSTTLSSIKFEQSFMSVYPNPVIGNQVNVRFGNFVNDTIAVSIYSLQGAKVFEDKFVVNSETLTFSLNNTLSAGTYILETIMNGQRHTHKLLFM